ncbi:hypothetical protein ACFSTC_33635 [Nonomuraea ferruginea]
MDLVKLFHDVVETVPAYRAFLAEHDIDPAQIRTFQDFCGLADDKQGHVHATPPAP